MCNNEPVDVGQREFKVLLNGNQDLREQLEQFKKTCEAHEKHRRRRCKKRYYQLGLMARIVSCTTEEEFRGLLHNGARTFMFNTVSYKEPDLLQLVKRTMDAVDLYQTEEPSKRIVTGMAFEINGDACRLGRMRNDGTIIACRCEVMTLTIDESYRYSGFKEVVYVINLKYYFKNLKICDVIKIGDDVVVRVVKILATNIAVLIETGGVISSYDFVEIPDQCVQRSESDMISMFKSDLELAADLDGNYIVMPKIRCRHFLRVLRHHMESEFKSLKLIGYIDLQYARAHMVDLIGLIKCLDYLWIPDFYKLDCDMQNYVFDDVMPMAKCLKKPIIGSVPLQRCSEFKSYESHDFLWKIDAIFIEKSSWCCKYPLIVKKLLPIRDFHFGVLDNAVPIKNLFTSYLSIVNFIIRTISTIECQAIFLYTRCEAAAIAMSRVEIYCPVYVMIPLSDDSNTEAEMECKLNMARALNLRRNVRAILYTAEMNFCNNRPIDYGIEFARKNGCVEVGDFIITIEVIKEDQQDAQIGGTEDVVVMRAYYLPPMRFTEKFKYS